MSERKKPVGGVVAVRISAVGATAQPDLPLVEGRSSYVEELVSDNGIPRVHHTLLLVVSRETAREFLPFAARMAAEGASAVVTTAAGEQLVVGWTEALGWEHPLRLTALDLGAGAKPADGNEATLRFECDDTTALQQE